MASGACTSAGLPSTDNAEAWAAVGGDRVGLAALGQCVAPTIGLRPGEHTNGARALLGVTTVSRWATRSAGVPRRVRRATSRQVRSHDGLWLDLPPMRILFFGTFDERTHPRVRVLREGLIHHGLEVDVCNAPLAFRTADRVQLAKQPWRAPLLLMRLASCWWRLCWASRHARPDVVVVGYLGQFDIHLARLRFRHSLIVLDQMVGLGDTARDRGIRGNSAVVRLLDLVDRLALRAADIILVDTEEHIELVPPSLRARALIVGVGAPEEWTSARRFFKPSEALRIVFFGLYTPLQGSPVIGAALRSIREVPLACTMVGQGQDLESTRRTIGDDPRVTWIEWLDERDLARLVAEHDVCLGIFGTTPKALRVVPNKVFQGAAAGCAIVTSDTPPQRRALGDCAVFVRPGDAIDLAASLRSLAADAQLVTRLRSAAADQAERCFSPQHVVEPLVTRLRVEG